MAQLWRRASLANYVVIGLVGAGLGLLSVFSPLLAVGAVLGVTFVIAALSKPMLLCYMMVPAIVLTSGMERGRLVPLLKLNEAGLVLSVAVVLLTLLANKRWRRVDLRYGIAALIVYTPWVVFFPLGYYLLRGAQLTIKDIFWLIAPLQYFLTFWLFAVVPENEEDRRRLILWMLLCVSIVAIVGLGQAAGLGVVNKLLASWYPSDHLEAVADGGSRITSLLAAWNALGILMATNAMVGWAILPVVGGTLGPVIVLVTFALSSICLLASGSFAGIGGLIMGMGLIEVVAQRGMRMVPIVIAGVVAIGLVFIILQPILLPLIENRLDYQFGHRQRTPQTMRFRIEVWREIFMPPIREHFPWPVHPSIPERYAWDTEESQYIMLLFRMGLPGLLGHLAWVGVTLLWLFRRLFQADGLLKAMITSAIALFIVLSIQGLTNDVFTWAGSMDFLWILLGLIANSKEI